MGNPPGKQYVNVLFDDEILSRIDDFRYKHRVPSRTEAIRWLIKEALDKKLVPKAARKGEV